MNYRKALFTGATAAVLLSLSGTNLVRADIPSWFWGSLFTWADGVTAEVDVAKAEVAVLTAQVASLESQLTVMETYVQDLQSYVSVDDTTDPGRPVVIVSGANLQVVNGLGSTPTVNGVGNLLLGYDENMSGVCTIVESGPEIYDDVACGSAGGFFIPTSAVKTGSHNLVVGDRHTYTSFSGMLGGTANYINGKGASVTGGHYSTVNGNWSSVSGGELNIVYASRASISGGASNTINLTARDAAISGGTSNNVQNGARYGSISGGSAGSVSGASDWRAGTLFEDD